MFNDSITAPWIEDLPVYMQLAKRLRQLILSGEIAEGAKMPSTREIAKLCMLNHLTAAKAVSILQKEGIANSKRGVGMFVAEGAKQIAKDLEVTEFYGKELPRFIQMMKLLDIPKESVNRLILTRTSLEIVAPSTTALTANMVRNS